MQPLLFRKVLLQRTNDAQLKTLDAAGRCVDRRLETGWCTCFDEQNPSTGRVEVSVVLGSDGTTWVPFNQALPAPKGFRLGNFPTYQVAYETGQAGDPSVDSELTIAGYKRKRDSYWPLLNKLIIRLRDASKGSPQRWHIQFPEDSVPLVDDVHPEVAKTVANVTTPPGASFTLLVLLSVTYTSAVTDDMNHVAGWRQAL